MTDWNDGRRLTRRKFLKDGSRVGAGVAVAPLVLNLSACSSKDDAGGADDDPSAGPLAARNDDAGAPDAGDTGSGERGDAGVGPGSAGDNPKVVPMGDDSVLLGLYPGDGTAAMMAAADKLDFSWLGAGESVLIKVACNSGNPHPATTSPAGVKGMVDVLMAKGAGRVIVADQGGVEHVRNSAAGRASSTRELFMSNGLIALEGYNGAELHFFDDQPFDSGYFEATLPDDNRWPRGLYLANIIKEADHIIYMPRISAHTLAGLTHAQKSAIGWLRDDSRHDLHNDAAQFYEKYTEISYTDEIRSRFRMAVTVSESMQLFGGPDEGTAFEMDPPLVLASRNLANHDAMASSLLVTLQAMGGAAPSGMVYNSGTASLFNTFFAGGTGVAIGDAGAWISQSSASSYTAHTFADVMGERAVVRGWDLAGGKPERIQVVHDGEAMDEALVGGLESHGAGIYAFA